MAKIVFIRIFKMECVQMEDFVYAQLKMIDDFPISFYDLFIRGKSLENNPYFAKLLFQNNFLIFILFNHVKMLDRFSESLSQTGEIFSPVCIDSDKS